MTGLPNPVPVYPLLMRANASGYRPEGPMEDLGAIDPLGLTRSAMLFVTGYHPALIQIGFLDQATASAGSRAIVTALFDREGRGKDHVAHVALFSTGLWLSYPNLLPARGMSLDFSASGRRSFRSPRAMFFAVQTGPARLLRPWARVRTWF